MRVYELFENDSLTEIRMDPSSLAQATQGLDARVGIEFEMVVPGGGTSEDDFEPEPNYDPNRRIRNFGDVLDFFYDGNHNDQRSIDRLERELQDAYNDWVSEKFDQYWADNINDEIDDYVKNNISTEQMLSMLGIDDENRDGLAQYEYHQILEIVSNDESLMDEIRNQAQEEYFNDHDIDEWITNEHRYMSDISDNYSSVSWPYWTRYEADDDDNVQRIADEFSEAVGRPVRLSSRYHGIPRDDKSYVVEPDSSIKADSEEVGLEFISPPLPLDEIVKDIDAIKQWAASVGAYTNKSTGLHMNISIPGLTDQSLDYVKLALLLGDEYVLQQFGREANTYTVGALKQIQNQVRKLDTTAIEKYLNQIKSGLNERASELLQISGFGKYTSINPKTGYIEFRSPGGDYLNEPTDKLVNTLRRFIVATKSAIDPNADRREYISKLTKLLTPPKQTPTDTIQYFARYSAGELPKSALKSFIKQTQLQRQAQRRQLPPGQKIEWEVLKQSDINNQNYSSLRVVAASEAEARQQATTSGMGWTWLDPDQLIARPAPPQVNTGGLPQQQYPSLNLTAPESNPDANYAIIRNSDNTVIEYYTRNTPTEALQGYMRWLGTMGNDTERLSRMYRFEPVTPRSSLQSQSVQWRILVDGEEVHRFWNRNVQSDANTAARQWVLDQIRRGFLWPTAGAEVEVVPVTNN